MPRPFASVGLMLWSLVLSILLSGCQGIGETIFGSDDSGSGVLAHPVKPFKNPATLRLNDPLLEHQWALFNSGQSALALSGSGGLAGADVGAFNGSMLTAKNYAGGMQGRGVNIAIVDTSIDLAHADLSPNVLIDGSYDFLTGSVDNPRVSEAHGTSVSGLASARGGNNIGIWGVAPLAGIQGFNVLETGDLTSELAALGLASARASFTNMRSDITDVFNKSYGANPDSVATVAEKLTVDSLIDSMESGTIHLRSGLGALYVKAAGNEYDGGGAFSLNWCKEAVANNITCYNVNQESENATPFQMVVGAFNANDKRSSYSNTGSALWVVAPGGELGVDSPALMTTDVSGCSDGYSTTKNGKTSFDAGDLGTGNEDCDYYSAFNGTSSAAPMVSGLVALLLEAYPQAGWRDIKHFIASQARQIQPDLSANTLQLTNATTQQTETVTIEQAWVTNAAGVRFSNEYGFGAINLSESVKMAKEWHDLAQKLPGLVLKQAKKQVLTQENTIVNVDAAGLERTQMINDVLTLETLKLTLSIKGLDNERSGSDTHKIDPSDYLIALTSPSGTKSILMTPFNAFRTGFDLLNFELATHAFYGEPITGEWTLSVTDVDGSTQNRIKHAGEGKLLDWQLSFYGHRAP